ncbi:TetR/AcrR family transcriptional regulator [Reyranella sp. CPCC 100927]|nr:TetR/AcrR family transcriptional regulator [Reyranella sp. CPCC 100927]
MAPKIGESEARTAPATSRPRDRIVATARDLFYRHGVKGVGVETIAESAGTNKMTLYRHFDTKDDLIAECVQQAMVEGFAELDQLTARHAGDPMGELRAWIEHATHQIVSEPRGCAMANAAVELAEEDHPVRRIIEDGKKRFREYLVELCQRAGLSRPDLAADTLMLLHEGARISRQSEGVQGSSERFKSAAEGVIASFSARHDKS